jgi:hypothetical protein
MADNRAEQILKTFLSFNPKTDLNDNESKEKMASLFREFLMSSDNAVVEVLPKFIQSLKDVISNLGFGEQSAEEVVEPEEDVINTSLEDQEDTEKENGDAEDVEEEVPEEKALESFKRNKHKRLVENANDYIY